jgi:DNA-binding GntR family transcriptional regulator
MHDRFVIERHPAPLRVSVVNRLRAAVIEGVFRPGDRLVEVALAAQFQVSRPLIREAIRQLEAEDLVEVIANRGCVVRAIGLQEVDEIDDLRAVVEGLAARYFAERGTPEQIERLDMRLTALEATLAEGDRPAIVLAKHAYYEAFLAGAQSKLVQSYARQLIARISYLWSSALERPGRIERSIAEMRAILDAIRRRDAGAAAAAAALHVHNGTATGRQALQRLSSQQPGAPSRRRATSGGRHNE